MKKTTTKPKKAATQVILPQQSLQDQHAIIQVSAKVTEHTLRRSLEGKIQEVEAKKAAATIDVNKGVMRVTKAAYLAARDKFLTDPMVGYVFQAFSQLFGCNITAENAAPSMGFNVPWDTIQYAAKEKLPLSVALEAPWRLTLRTNTEQANALTDYTEEETEQVRGEAIGNFEMQLHLLYVELESDHALLEDARGVLKISGKVQVWENELKQLKRQLKDASSFMEDLSMAAQREFLDKTPAAAGVQAKMMQAAEAKLGGFSATMRALE